MKLYWSNGRVVLWQGHVLDCLAAMEAGSAHMVATSPPYYSLRDYDLPPVEWPAVSYAPMAGLPPLDIPGCDLGCAHVWVPLNSKEAKAFSGKVGAAVPVHQVRESPATADVEVDNKASGVSVEGAAELVGDKENVQAISEGLATSRERCAPGLVNASVAVKLTSDKVPGELFGDVGENHSLALAGMDAKFGKSISQPDRPDTPTVNNSASLGVLNSDRRLGGNESLDELDKTAILADKADGPVVSNVSIGQHQTDKVGEIGRPGNKVVPEDSIAEGSVGDTPLAGTNVVTEFMGGHLAMPRGAQSNNSAKLTSDGEPGISTGSRTGAPLAGVGGLDIEGLSTTLTNKSNHDSSICLKCGGVKCSLGLEPTPEMFVGHIVLVARALWRVLRDDGTFWLNLGSSYQDKQELGIPWRVAFALQADNWILRSDIIWAKGVSFCPTYSGSCMPESVTDRPTKGHEYVFLLSKNKRYFYDGDAVREANAINPNWNYGSETYRRDTTQDEYKIDGDNKRRKAYQKGWSGLGPAGPNGSGRNLRTVWTINPGSYAGAHFATFPPALVEPMIKAGTSAKGCCPECGASWVRVTERAVLPPPDRINNNAFKHDGMTSHGEGAATLRNIVENTTTGWRPTCSCGTEHPIPQEELDADPSLLDDFEIEPFEPVPCTVLDPFLGSGTTAEVADFLGRHSVGIELSKKYCDDHIIPRLTEPLFEWAEQEQQEPEPEIEQMGLL